MLNLIAFVGLASAAPAMKKFETKVEHFKNEPGQEKFNLRYIIDDQYFKNCTGNNETQTSQSCPIFLYTGNEEDIEKFYNNSGWITGPLAKNFSALVVFAEHRYFGESFPGWPEGYHTSFNNGKGRDLKVENVLMDWVLLLDQIKADYNAKDKAVITFGGSYGGMLAAWMRMKYPMHVQGAIASSAPLISFPGSE